MTLNYGNSSLQGIVLRAIGWMLLVLILVILGIACAILPPLYILAFFSAPLAILIATIFPALALSTILLIAFGLVPSFLFPTLTFGGATFQPAELMLMFTFCIVLIKGYAEWKGILPRAKPLRLALILLSAGLVIGLINGKLLGNYHYAMADFRQYLGWLALPIALWLASRNPESIHRIVLTIALLAAAMMAFQMLTGIRVIYGFRGAEILTKEFSDVSRSAIGGGEIFLIYAAYYLFVRFCEADRGRLWILLGMQLIFCGLIASFSRGVWAGFLLGGIIFIATLPQLKRNKTSIAILIAALILGVGSLAVLAVPRIGEAAVERVLSVKDEGKSGSSLGFRFDENQQALDAIKRSPIFGRGLGVEYKRAFRQSGSDGGFEVETSFVHNGYMNLWLKLGIVGLAYPFVLIFSLWKIVKEKSKATGVADSSDRKSMLRAYAAFSTLISFAVLGLTAPVWSTTITVAVASCLVALIIGSSRIEEAGKKPRNCRLDLTVSSRDGTAS